MKQSELDEIEVALLLEAVFLRYGYDFRSYARASIVRLLRQLLEQTGFTSPIDLIPKLLRDPAVLQQLLGTFSVTVSGMFRDPGFYRTLRRDVVPMLWTYPFIRVWVAGCACGEEAYSMAILLQEEGLAGQSTIYATDLNDQALAAAREGVYSLKQFNEYAENYRQSGGCGSFSRCWQIGPEHAVITSNIKKIITFASHNLVSDQVFAEMHLILCRNVMIYFNQELKERVLRLIDSSLIRGGFLCLGANETLRTSCLCRRYDEIDSRNKVYRKQVRAAS